MLLVISRGDCFRLLGRSGRLPAPGRPELDAIVLDADGTMLDPDHVLRPQVADAISEARESGLQVHVATGRARSGPWVEQLLAAGFGPAGVFLQGLTAFNDSGERIHDAKLAPSVLNAVQKACDGEDVAITAYCHERLLCLSLNEATACYAAYGEAQPEACSSLNDYEPNKLLILASAEKLPELRKRLEDALWWQPARVVIALDWTIEILPARMSKGAGVRVLLDSLGLKPSRVMAVGDGENDLELIRMVGLGVAMGNAVPRLKKAAVCTVASNAEAGVAQAIRELALPRAANRVS